MTNSPYEGNPTAGQGWSSNEVTSPYATPAPQSAYGEIQPIQQSRPVSAGRLIPPVYFDGGAGSYVVVGIVGFLITGISLGLLFPLAFMMRIRWRVEHTLIEGRRMQFNGTGLGLFGMWLKWWFFLIITLGWYIFWLQPRLERWTCEHTTLAPPVR